MLSGKLKANIWFWRLMCLLRTHKWIITNIAYYCPINCTFSGNGMSALGGNISNAVGLFLVPGSFMSVQRPELTICNGRNTINIIHSLLLEVPTIQILSLCYSILFNIFIGGMSVHH